MDAPAQSTEKVNFAHVSLQTVMEHIGQENFSPWKIAAGGRSPSPILQENLNRLVCFDLTSDAGKLTIINALFSEIVSFFPRPRIWRDAPFASDKYAGTAAYLMAAKRAYLAPPFVLCVAQAQKDDFEQGREQCLAQMTACQWNNAQAGRSTTVYGIVSNADGWQFYQLTPQNQIGESHFYSLQNLSELLGVLHFVCAECAKNAP